MINHPEHLVLDYDFSYVHMLNIDIVKSDSWHAAWHTDNQRPAEHWGGDVAFIPRLMSHKLNKQFCLSNLVSWVFNILIIVCVCRQQARDVRNNEVVAIKKMSYSGKQTNEVTNHKDTKHFLFRF